MEAIGGQAAKAHDGIRPWNERAGKAKEYHAVRDPETEGSGGRNASGSHPSGEIPHGLSHGGGPGE